MGTKFLGTICSGGPNLLGTVCLEEPINWGPIVGDQMSGDHMCLGPQPWILIFKKQIDLKTILASLCSSSRFDLAANQKISWPFLVKRFSSPSAMASPRRKDRFFFHSLTYKQLSSTNTVSGVAENFQLLTGSSHILVTLFLVFCHLGWVIFCMIFSVCKARWARWNEK